ncbi:hypothetical protein L2E82_38056 [Cichorium intybus]|uniref:Uncharacterized protein n=1 Tax=Cichorium intybus TaxID=13427 RepID=A0ACB9AGH2_CICIN|nr:hypothetical protein L2E82_38056 [Cichorium intybus]
MHQLQQLVGYTVSSLTVLNQCQCPNYLHKKLKLFKKVVISVQGKHFLKIGTHESKDFQITVREFIKSVYVDKKIFASKTSGKPPLNLRNNEDETRRASSYHSYSQSPPYDSQYEERRYGKQAPSLTKKPGSDRGMLRFMSTSRLSDHVQEDRFANEVVTTRVSDYSASSGGDPFRSGTQSPTFQRELGFSSLSREMSRDNLSEDVSSPKVKGESDQAGVRS